ncbi:MAG: hypothetical protein VX438_04380 [Planctomycetota bacterium]|nr:hypothetical protein [Planctomycetota bacterium]
MTHQFRNAFLGLILSGICLSGCNQEAKKDRIDEENTSEVRDTHPVTIVFLESNKSTHAELKSTLAKKFQSLDLGTPNFESRSVSEFVADPIPGDLVLYPPNAFGDLFQKELLRPIPSYVVDSTPYRLSDVLRNQRRMFGIHQKTYYATSLGVSSYMLLCHRNLLDANGLSVPQTWAEYENVCQQLATLKKNKQLKSISNLGRFSPAIEPLKENWKAVSLLARTASSIRTSGRYSVCFDYSTWNPLVNSPPFAKALTQQKNSFQLMHTEHRDLDPREVERAFLNHECVLAITWPHPPSVEEKESAKKTEGAEAYLLPGSNKKYNYSENTWNEALFSESRIQFLGASGLCCSILKSSLQSGVATRRLALISGKELSGLIGKENPQTGFPYRASHLTKAHDWISPKYSAHFSELFCTIVEQQNQAKVWMCRPRYQKSAEYESILAVEIRQFLNGNSTALQSLSKVSKKWKQLGESLDLEFQKQVNLETLGAK